MNSPLVPRFKLLNMGLIICLTILLGNTVVLADQQVCSLGGRFSAVSQFDDLINEFDFGTRADKLAIQLADVEYKSALVAVDEIPVQITYQGSIDRDLDLNSESPAVSSNAVSSSVDITPGAFDRTHRLRVLEAVLAEVDLRKNELAGRVNTLTTLFQIHEAMKIRTIYELESKLAQDRLAYYEKRKGLGESVQTQIADFTTLIRESSDRSRSLEVRQLNLASSVDLMPEAYGLLADIDVSFLTVDPVHCQLQSFQTKTAQVGLEIAALQLDSARSNRLPSVEAGLTVNQERSAQRETLDSELSITVRMDLYQGGALSNAESDAERRKELARTRADLLSQLDTESALRQYSIEEIYRQSFDAQSQRLRGVRQKISELLDRKQLGQSVYEELSDTMLEELRIQESIVRLKTEAMLSWLNFMVDKNE